MGTRKLLNTFPRRKQGPWRPLFDQISIWALVTENLKIHRWPLPSHAQGLLIKFLSTVIIFVFFFLFLFPNHLIVFDVLLSIIVYSSEPPNYNLIHLIHIIWWYICNTAFIQITFIQLFLNLKDRDTTICFTYSCFFSSNSWEKNIIVFRLSSKWLFLLQFVVFQAVSYSSCNMFSLLSQLFQISYLQLNSALKIEPILKGFTLEVLGPLQVACWCTERVNHSVVSTSLWPHGL